MSFFKRIGKAFKTMANPKSILHPKQAFAAQATLMDPGGAHLLGLDKALDPKKAALPGGTPEDYQGELNKELANYQTIPDQALTGATADAKTAGTYGDTAADKIQIQGEADAESRFGKRASLAKINALQSQLGVPQTPAGQI